MSARHRSAGKGRRDPVQELRQARDALWDIRHLYYARSQAAWELSSGQTSGSAYSDHAYVSARLEAAHAHMVGRDRAERALHDAYAAPRPPASERERAREMFADLLSDYCWHKSGFSDHVQWIEDWIKRFDVRPVGRPEPEREAER